MHKWILTCGFVAICCSGFSQDNPTYINLYKSIAVAEMMRTGIPASIKLAQAILESNCGKSELACKANNHFGIKCGSDWQGKSFNKEDDDFEGGKLVKSCFREYSSVYDSYIAHSDFLTDPGKSARYGALFKLETNDYKGWAKGLSHAGYATDPQYSKRLIDIIEKYQLYQLDAEIDGIMASGVSTPVKSHRTIRYQNDVKYVVASEGDNPMVLADVLDLSPRQILRYNDGIRNENQTLEAGSYVYLQPKRNKYNGHQKYHMLKPNEDLIAVSQKYGIKHSALLKRNGLIEGQTPAPNQKLMLKGKPTRELRIADPYIVPPEKKQEDHHELVSESNSVDIPTANKVIPVPAAKKDSTVITTPKISSPLPGHTVAKGETLFGIAQSYGLSVTELKKMNNLSADTIFIGQNLLVR